MYIKYCYDVGKYLSRYFLVICDGLKYIKKFQQKQVDLGEYFSLSLLYFCSIGTMVSQAVFGFLPSLCRAIHRDLNPQASAAVILVPRVRPARYPEKVSPVSVYPHL